MEFIAPPIRHWVHYAHNDTAIEFFKKIWRRCDAQMDFRINSGSGTTQLKRQRASLDPNRDRSTVKHLETNGARRAPYRPGAAIDRNGTQVSAD